MSAVTTTSKYANLALGVGVATVLTRIVLRPAAILTNTHLMGTATSQRRIIRAAEALATITTMTPTENHTEANPRSAPTVPQRACQTL